MKDLNKIITGDSCKCLSDKKQFADNSIDFIITSPPYDKKRHYAYNSISPEKYIKWFLGISKELFRVLKPRGSFVLNIKEGVSDGQRHTYVLELVLELKKQGWLWVEEYCWYKKNSFPGKWTNRFRDSWERCYHFAKQKNFKMYQDAVKIPIGDWSKSRFKSMTHKDFVRYTSQTNSNFGRNVSNWLSRAKVYPHNVLKFENEHYMSPSSVIQLATECKNRNHPATYPLELPVWFMRLFTRPNDVVLDPFLGSGTSALAAIMLDRRYIGIDLNPIYTKIAKRNVSNLISKSPLEIYKLYEGYINS